MLNINLLLTNQISQNHCNDIHNHKNYIIVPSTRDSCPFAYSEFQLRRNMACSVKALRSPLCRSVGHGNCSDEL